MKTTGAVRLVALAAVAGCLCLSSVASASVGAGAFTCVVPSPRQRQQQLQLQAPDLHVVVGRRDPSLPCAAVPSHSPSPPERCATTSLCARPSTTFRHFTDDDKAAPATFGTGTVVTAVHVPTAHSGASRRDVLSTLVFLAASSSSPFVVNADDTAEPFIRQGKGYGYTFTPPPGFSPGKKPVPTHLDEVNFNLEGVRGYQFGITVDPVRITTLREFGTPEEVAARVVTAEVNRDGIFTVSLTKDPAEDTSSGAYDIEYVSEGKRGTKHFVTRIYVKDQKLYVMTAQVKAEEFGEREKDIMDCVKTFKPL
eukprot:CAMPEP_0178480584 /NCGR_PEP_ID=MMETSP0696-20121128/5773_1 /TAXON_ID=265572 /ORGANISM="Extubocellulus spinifer, Strain CCMP396" /LENGTH=309 /DNA_ID=CAMNT_0020108033 /DNA_START=19 /DNA_END=948 /DNA_ORIENTATION=-